MKAGGQDILTYTPPREEELSLLCAVAPDEPLPGYVVAALLSEYPAGFRWNMQ